MNIKSINQDSVSNEEKQIFDVYLELLKTYNKVFIYKTDEQYFIYKPIGRKDFIKIFSNKELSQCDKEEVVCETCVLYPENYSFENCENAGTPTLLCRAILKASYCEDETQPIALMSIFREEMCNTQNQINCIIHEAFPNLDFEDIENFDMETALRYLSRAEWILVNLKKCEINYDPFSAAAEAIQKEQEETKKTEKSKVPITEIPSPQQMPQDNHLQNEDENEDDYIDFIPGETVQERYERLRTKKIKKEVLTPEKLAKLQRIAPEINWKYQNKEEDFMHSTH